MNNPFNLASFRLIFIYTMLLGLSVGLVLMFLFFTTARDIELEADQKIIEKVEDLNNIFSILRGECDTSTNKRTPRFTHQGTRTFHTADE